jgi:hypothetical protein
MIEPKLANFGEEYSIHVSNIPPNYDINKLYTVFNQFDGFLGFDDDRQRTFKFALFRSFRSMNFCLKKKYLV